MNEKSKNTTPDISQGKFIPYAVLEQEFKDKKNKYLLKKQFRHDWLIALFSTFGGAFAGFLTSLIFWLLTK